MSHQPGLSTSPSGMLSPSQDAEYRSSSSLGKRWNGDGTGSVVVPDPNVMGVGGPRMSPAGDWGPYGSVCPGPGYPRNVAVGVGRVAHPSSSGSPPSGSPLWGNRPVGSPSGSPPVQSRPIGSPIGSPVGNTRPIGSPIGQQRLMESPTSQGYMQQNHPVGQQPNTSPLSQARILHSPLASPMSQTRLLGGGSPTVNYRASAAPPATSPGTSPLGSPLTASRSMRSLGTESTVPSEDGVYKNRGRTRGHGHRGGNATKAPNCRMARRDQQLPESCP